MSRPASLLALFLVVSSAGAQESVQAVPLLAGEFQISSCGRSVISAGGQGLGSQSVLTQQARIVRRFALGVDGLYWGLGLQGEVFSFGGAARMPSGNLRDFASTLSLEYYREGEQVASLSLKPGFYFEHEVRSDSFDVPAQLITGVPITQDVSGVVGGAAARFYRRPIPIAGLVWKFRPVWRLEAVFPEPALIYAPNKRSEARVGGELQSGGFRTGTGDSLEYYSYQLKGRLDYSLNTALKVSCAIGYELSRTFDYSKQSQRYVGDGAWVWQLGCGLAF
jgi:hypothetical protein